ncbi:MAG TPA: transglutaminase domain-containing protein [Saprospiraceae bacterium]|nr:transglutaminase domain-containing protein [Saprospiraceae bacterium]
MKYFLTILFSMCLGWGFAQPEYEALDTACREFNRRQYDTPEALARDLCKDLKTDREKARAIYSWIAQSIDYQKVPEVEARTRQEYCDRRVKQVFRSGRGVCMDYSLLYQRMAQAVGLDCAFIEGHAKTFNGNWESHAWNAVKLGDKWELLDATWGAGYRNDQGKFIREFQPGHFFVEPRIFLLTHYPEETKWQLIDQPISAADFKKLSFYANGDLQHGIQDAVMEQAPGGKIRLKLKIQQPNTHIFVQMSGKDLDVQRKDQDGWTTLVFKPTAAQKFQVWGGEKKNNKIQLALMGEFYRQ